MESSVSYVLTPSKSLNRVLGFSGGKEVIISVGYGILQAQEVSVRLVAYLLPAIYLAKQLKSQGCKVRIRSYFATGAARVVFGRSFNISAISGWADKAGAYLRKFMVLFHPEIQFDIFEDGGWDGRTGEAVDQLAQVLRRDRALMVEITGRFSEPAQSIKYLAAHSLYMLDPLQSKWAPVIVGEELPERDSCVIVIAGEQEKITYRVRTLLGETIGLHNRWDNLTVFTTVGQKPVYNEGAKELYVSQLAGLDVAAVWAGRGIYESEVFDDLQLLAASIIDDLPNKKDETVFCLGLEELATRITSN